MRRVIKNIFVPTVLKRTLFFLIADTLLVEAAVYLSFFLRFEGAIPFSHFSNLLFLAAFAPFVVIPLFLLQRLYWVSWSYVGLGDFVSILRGVVISFLLIGVVILILRGEENVLFGDLLTFPRSTLFISAVLAAFFIGALRASKRVYIHSFRESSRINKEGKKVLIIGAGDAGEQILRSMVARGERSLYFPVGFVDDDPLKRGVSIHGYSVLGKIDQLSRVIADTGTEMAIIALPSSGSREIRRAVEACRKAGISDIKIVPALAELISRDVSFRDLREIKIGDLLGREPVELDFAALDAFIRNKRVLITGAAGSVGSELARQTAKFQPAHLVLLDQEETNLFYLQEEFKRNFSHIPCYLVIADIKNKNKINRVFRELQPEIVFHAAAYKHVPVMEEHADEAVKNNILGTLVVAEEAALAGVKKFVFISTDKAVRPASVMGATKRITEILMMFLNKKSATDFVSVRFGNILDSRGSVVAIFREQIKHGGPLTITHPDMTRYFMAPSEAVLLVMQAGAIGEGGKIYMLDMGSPIRIFHLAEEMIRISGFEPDVDIPIVFTGPRPGEKIFEELFRGGSEKFSPTSYSKIFEVSGEHPFDFERFRRDLEELFRLAEIEPPALVRERVKQFLAAIE